MADAERPAGADARPSLRAVRGGVASRSSWQPRELAHRLSALERQVEAALASTGVGDLDARQRLGVAVDGVLDGYVRLRRFLVEDVVEGRAIDGITGMGLRALCRYWWRIEVRGLERVPTRGRVLLVANRAGTLLPYDALVLPTALALDRPEARRAFTLVEEWFTRLPVVGDALERIDALAATPGTLRRLLDRDQAVVAFPTAAMPFDRRYRIGRFGHPAFIRVAIETGTPIVPVAVIGAEESQPVLTRIAGPKVLGLPALPVTPTFPFLGLAGLVPLPTKWTIHVGEPLAVAERYPAASARDAAAMRRLREQVRERLQALVSEGLRRRRGLFVD